MPTLKIAKPTTDTLADLIDDYLDDCRRGANGHKRLSAKTVRYSYGFPLKGVFLQWAEGEGITSPKQLDQQVVDRFAEHQKNRTSARGKPLTVDSISTYVGTVQHWINWLARKGYVEAIQGRKGLIASAQATVEPPRPKLKDVLSRDEIKLLERAAGDRERDKLIIRVLADTGMRVGELCSLRITDLRETRLHAKGEAGRFLRVSGKTGDRDVPVFDPDVWQRLKNYRDRLRPDNAKSDKLFLVRRRHVEGGEYDAITESGVFQMVKAIGEEAGIPRAHPHLFRHSAATWMLQRGMDSVTVAKILGHSSLNMINRVYAHIAPTDTFAAMVKYLSD